MEYQNKPDEKQNQQTQINTNRKSIESNTQDLKKYNNFTKTQQAQVILQPLSVWQLSTVALLVIAVIIFGLYSYFQLKSHLQQYDSAIHQKIDQLTSFFQSQKYKLHHKFQNFTMEQLNLYLELNQTLNKITKNHDKAYQSIKSIFAIKQQINGYKNSNAKNFDWMTRQIGQIDWLRKQIQQYYAATKPTAYVPVFKKLASDGGLSYLNNQQYFQKVVWLFVDSFQSDWSYSNSLYYRNIKYFSQKSGFEVKLVTMNNYLYYLSPQRVRLLTNTFSMLRRIIREEYGRTNLNDHFQNIAKVLILTHILEQHGGIIIKDYLVLVESLDWIYNITEYQFVNKGNGNTSPKVIAFFDTEYSSIKRIEKKDNTSDNQTPMYKFPSLQQNFIMAVKNSQLITQINREMIRILSNATAIKYQIQAQQYEMNIIKGLDPYYQFFFIASHIVLQTKQRQLDQWVYLDAGDYPTKFALDYYGLYTINRYYGPYKLKIFVQNKDEIILFNYLAKISVTQLEQKIGKIRFISQLKFSRNLHQKLKQIKENNKVQVMRDSFIQKMLFPNQNVQNIQFYDNQDPLINYPMQITRKWQQLPKIIWIYSSSYINDDLKIIQEKCINRIRYLAEKSNFTVNVVTQDIANMYLSSETVQKLNSKLNRTLYPEHFRLRQTIIVLAILARFGGVYIQSSSIALQSFDWIVNIPSMNPRFINNRMGEVPNVLLFTNPWFSQNFKWVVNKQFKSRQKSDVVYDYSFIAAKKDSKVITGYLQNLLKFIRMQFDNIQSQLKKCGVQNPISKDHRPDLLPHDSLTCAMKKGTRTARTQALKLNGEFNIWSLDGESNVFKFNSANNYENVHKNQNLFLASYPIEYVRKIVGRFDKLIKLEEDNLAYLNTKIKNYELDNNGKINSNSIISKYLLSKFED